MTTKFPALDWTPAAPQVCDGDARARFLADLHSHFSLSQQSILQPHDDLLGAIASCSPYLSRLMIRYKALTLATITESQIALPELILSSYTDIVDRDGMMRDLRRAKDQAALSVALGDLSGRCEIMGTAEALSHFARHAIDLALCTAWKNHAATLGDRPVGLFILGMGKLGADELNYSSDIDLIALYDPQTLMIVPDGDIKKICVEIIRETIHFLNDQTADGYVFRTDLRLRPDPGVSAVAISIVAAENYYEAHGQNWERAAFIKADPVAGDLALGKQFLASLRPFIWRRYLDFAAIEDVHAIREKIAAAHGDAGANEQVLAGHNVKLGQGGIREIEFFVQTQQLVAGGKQPELRCRSTLQGLVALVGARILDAGVADRLGQAYTYLRFVEHRLQMIQDQQTHTIADDHADLDRVRAFCGFATLDAFASVHARANDITRDAYRGLFTKSARGKVSGQIDDAQRAMVLDFAGTDAVKSTLDTLSQLGFDPAEDIDRLIRGWLRGEYRATRSARSKSLISRFLPALLKAIGKASDPHSAFLAFDRFLSTLPAGVQLFSLFDQNVEIFDKLIALITVSPRLAGELSRSHHFVETLLAGGGKQPIDTMVSGEDSKLEESITRFVFAEADSDLELIINRLAIAISEAQFTNAALLAQGVISVTEAANQFTRIADICLSVLVPQVQLEIENQYGPINGQLCVLGFGRLGNCRMTFASDIDVVFVYDAVADVKSAGAKAIDAMTWYGRLVRRIVTALSSGARGGAIFPVDMQLRPSGGAGPAAVRLAAFREYYRNDAWIWELMALTKARIVVGAEPLRTQINDEITSALVRKRERNLVASAVLEMRTRLLTEKPPLSIWDRKNVEGGLIDAEFILQFLTLTTASTIGLAPTNQSLQPNFFADHGLLTTDQARTLGEALALNDALMQLARLGGGAVYAPKADGEALRERMITVCAASSLNEAESNLVASQQQVSALFKAIIVA